MARPVRRGSGVGDTSAPNHAAVALPADGLGFTRSFAWVVDLDGGVPARAAAVRNRWKFHDLVQQLEAPVFELDAQRERVAIGESSCRVVSHPSLTAAESRSGPYRWHPN